MSHKGLMIKAVAPDGEVLLGPVSSDWMAAYLSFTKQTDFEEPAALEGPLRWFFKLADLPDDDELETAEKDCPNCNYPSIPYLLPNAYEMGRADEKAAE